MISRPVGGTRVPPCARLLIDGRTARHKEPNEASEIRLRRLADEIGKTTRRAQAEENGRHLANRHHKEELENARAGAEQITKNGEAWTAVVADKAAPYLPEAVAALVELVLPARSHGEP